MTADQRARLDADLRKKIAEYREVRAVVVAIATRNANVNDDFKARLAKVVTDIVEMLERLDTARPT